MTEFQRIVKLLTLEINWKKSGVCSTQRQSKRMGIPSIIIMDLTVHKEKVIELRIVEFLKENIKNLIETNECREVLGASISIVGGVVYYSYRTFLQDYNFTKKILQYTPM